MLRLGSLNKLEGHLHRLFGDRVRTEQALGELTARVRTADWLEIAADLRDDADLAFGQLIDVCGVDYQEHGVPEWDNSSHATHSGFSRAVDARTGARRRFDPSSRLPPALDAAQTDGASVSALDQTKADTASPVVASTTASNASTAETSDADSNDLSDRAHRFWGVYHLLSHRHNWRLRVKVPAINAGGLHQIDSVVEVWRAADWFEREAFDLFGLHFRGHPDLRRLLTDYGFIGHPMRKDFPLIGEVEVRYDSEQQRVIYQPVSIEPRVLVPKVIRPAPETPDPDTTANSAADSTTS